MANPLIPFITIFGSVIIAAAASWFLTYGAQRTKIRRIKRETLAALHQQCEEAFQRGVAAGRNCVDPEQGKALEQAYLDGYNAAVTNEREVEESYTAGRHRSTNDVPTSMFAVVPLSGGMTLLDDDHTMLMRASAFTPEGATEVVSSDVMSHNAT